MTTPQSHSWQHQHQQANLAPLPPDSYTAQLLQHATPDHIYLTSRRFFIGPIPEGWLKTNRRDWYKHHLHINYSSRAATFSADPTDSRNRRLSGHDGPSSSALFQRSFPQPEDLSAEDEDNDNENNKDGTDDKRIENGVSSSASATLESPPAIQIPRGSDNKDDVIVDDDATEYLDALSEPEDEPESNEDDGGHANTSKQPLSKSTSESTDKQTLVQASSAGAAQNASQPQASGLQVPTGQDDGQTASVKRPVSTVASDNGEAYGFAIDEPSVVVASNEPLLRKTDSIKDRPVTSHKSSTRNIVTKAKRRVSRQQSNDPTTSSDRTENGLSRKKTNLRNLVTFDVPEDSRRAEVQLKAKAAQLTIQRASTRLRRQKIQDGLVVKMERMLVRVDAAGKDVPDEFDENANQKIDSRVKEKWREYLVVCRHSNTDDADFILQMYKTRVIPEVEQKDKGKRATFQIPLSRKKSRVNMYSSLDKSVVVWEPVSRGTQIFIMQARTASNAVEWYTFLRNILGWRRSTSLQINIPDLSVSLHIQDPFKNLEAFQNEAQEAEGSSTEEAILRTMQAEQAVAQNLIKRCLEQLEHLPEWADVLDSWIKDQRIGLAWKRYDRLEWIHGANERKMYGTIAMQKSHELELRPKTHYPTTAVTRKKHKTLVEPVPVEGFLIRLTGQKGRSQRMGLLYHKRLYFATHDQYLVFSRPSKSTPPPPPRLPASRDAQVPSSQAVAQDVPESWAVNPFPVDQQRIEWLMEGHTGTPETRRLHDEDAADEAERKRQNLLACDGYIDMADIIKVRKAKKGADPVDEVIEDGSDIDFDEEVEDSTREDGATRDLDLERTFELVMRNGLIIRLQAANKTRRKEWIKHLRALAKYWKHRTASDINLFKRTRNRNFKVLNIDEEAEAYVGQFARKWEVTQSYACPELYNLCGIACCRSIHLSGLLYRKPRIHAPFTRCSVMLTAGNLVIFQDVLRSRVGKQLAHIHHERIANLDLKDCYVYSGFLTESDLLYQNQTFDANKPGHHALPRIYLEDGWTSTDEDVMTTFVVWHGKSKSWFRAEEGAGGGFQHANESRRKKLKRVAKLGSKGRSVVFRARSRAERDHWVLAIQNEIERVQASMGQDFRIEEAQGGNKASAGDDGNGTVPRSTAGEENGQA
ncbi:hypothetical protein BU24DRAFT_423164 [Aaosphaeria arxii CBS 175.79]|uniref:PH domain-containing protein n=1 Tax=Aaosphaeria arxii CBS 175.79 TaxID=1450172 RepID=A0A6A5XMT6_9PLEO|nr:uncharacterized protein BU24DRAFT_423164 [Aaosphaeria arxii CBS 175.79]KAF2014121.1 hypothetical protein BU24DRAFT_423164 [Aaosphaeria arxii CBS 175.79]